MNWIARFTKLIGLLFIFASCNGHVKTNSKPIIDQNYAFSSHKVDKLDSKAGIFYQDKMDNYWFGSEHGIYRYDGKIIELFTVKDGLISTRILSVQEDKKGNLFFDTPDGVSKFDGHSFTTLDVILADSTKNKWKSNQDDLWFSMGWNAKGPYRYDGERLFFLEFPKNSMEHTFYENYPNASYNPYGIYEIYKDSKKNIWFGTAQLGIYKFDGDNLSWKYEKEWTTTPQGGSFGIRSILEDKDGFFWFCNSKNKYKVQANKIHDDSLQSINLERFDGIRLEGVDTTYFMKMVQGNDRDIWMICDEVWRYNGIELKRYPIHVDNRKCTITTIFKDNYGKIWLSTIENGTFVFNGHGFENFIID